MGEKSHQQAAALLFSWLHSIAACYAQETPGSYNVSGSTVPAQGLTTAVLQHAAFRSCKCCKL